MQSHPSRAFRDVLRLTDGLLVQRALHAAAVLGIADRLKHYPRTAEDLAAEIPAHAGALHRMLSFLAGYGVFCEHADRRFANSALSDCLRSDVPQSVRSIVIFRGGQYYFRPFANFLHSVTTGLPALDQTMGIDGFQFLSTHPEEARMFDEAMTSLSALWAPFVAAAYPFGELGSLMDLGGGNGRSLAEILLTHPSLHGVLADRPHVLDRAKQAAWWSSDTAGRVEFLAVDFFEEVPRGCRAYLLQRIIHDWDDVRAARILRNCRQALPPGGVLLLIEYDLAADSSVGRGVDLAMLTLTGGRERTVEEHRELLAATGFRLTRTIPVAGDLLLLEAVPE